MHWALLIGVVAARAAAWAVSAWRWPYRPAWRRGRRPVIGARALYRYRRPGR